MFELFAAFSNEKFVANMISRIIHSNPVFLHILYKKIIQNRIIYSIPWYLQIL